MRRNILLLSMMIVVAITVFASDYPKPTAWVNDYAGVLTTSQQQELNGLLKDFETTTTNQIFVCIMSNLPANTTLEEYVNELFAAWKPGQQGEDNGVLLAVFINDRKLRIEVGYGLEAKLTDAASKLIIANDIAPRFKQAKYYQGIKNGLNAMMRTITSPQPGPTQFREPERHFWGIWIENILVRLPNDEGTYTMIFVGVFTIVPAIIFIAFIISTITKGGSITWSISSRSDRDWDDDRSSWNSSSSSSSRSNSRSSSSRGSSFSGGGGGSSGGGGASGSW